MENVDVIICTHKSPITSMLCVRIYVSEFEKVWDMILEKRFVTGSLINIIVHFNTIFLKEIWHTFAIYHVKNIRFLNVQWLRNIS